MGPMSPMTATRESESIWSTGERSPEIERLLCDKIGISSLVAAVLARRGISTPEAANAFLDASLDGLHDPTLLPDYRAAVDAILGAKERGETIYVHGDYDVDGVTSAALFSRFLEKIGCKVVTHVPHRKDGYGLCAAAVEDAVAHGAKLLLTCDCGISAIEEVEFAKAAGLAVVVTDHHPVGASLPRADAVVNPQRTDSLYPFAHLSGAGVVFKLCAGITKEIGWPLAKYYDHFLDLAALGTIADVMPLVGENRIIARHGLARIVESSKPGLKALLRVSGVADKLSGTGRLRAWHVSFGLGPRLNAAGRVDDARVALLLLLSKDEQESADLARKLEDLNEQRRAEQDRIVEAAMEQVLSTGRDKNSVILVYGDDWHPGVVGIVAGRLAERFHRPAFVVSVDKETGRAKGSARSIPAFNVAQAIHDHPGLIQGGGHAAAAGFGFAASQLAEVESSLVSYANARLKPEDFLSRVDVDLAIQPAEATLAAVEGLEKLEPFGLSNPTPLFMLGGMTLSQVIQTRNPDHPQALLVLNGFPPIRAAAFGMGKRLSDADNGSVIDAVVQLSVDEYKGNRKVKWVLKDLRPL